MESFGEKNSGLSSNRLTREQLGGEFATRTCDLEPHVNRVEKETVTAKAGLAEEINRARSELDTTEILPKAKKTARPSNRRRKIRVYFPSEAETHR
jgi:hypothetical protein